ncbi:SDR family oxidoreductase (plasmid) [Piscirickettsia salmonis]|nr:SDR family oxidoreductase [Piscirickettsia salmonis]
MHSFGSLKDLTEEKYEIIFNINVKGTLFFIQNFVTLIENNYGGSICLVGSDQSFVGKGSSVLYGATKGAIATITKSLAIDFASSNIRVNSVCPGTIETPLYHNAVKSNSHKLNMTNDDLYHILKTSQPIQRVGLPEEVSNVIYFLNSGEASFVTGSLYSVDGGYTHSNFFYFD